LAVCGHIVHKIPTPYRVFRLCGWLQRRPCPNFLPRLPLRNLQAALAPDASPFDKWIASS
jgi:hypothetical protein